MKEEKEADKFAVKKTNKELVLSFLNFLIKTRPNGKSGGLNDLGKKELELRIKYIKKLKFR